VPDPVTDLQSIYQVVGVHLQVSVSEREAGTRRPSPVGVSRPAFVLPKPQNSKHLPQPDIFITKPANLKRTERAVNSAAGKVPESPNLRILKEEQKKFFYSRTSFPFLCDMEGKTGYIRLHLGPDKVDGDFKQQYQQVNSTSHPTDFPSILQICIQGALIRKQSLQ